MLDVNNVLPTPHKDRKMKNFNGFDDVDVDEKKNRRKLKNVFKTNVSSQKIRMRKEEGATVAATPTFPQLAVSSGRTGSVLHGVIQTIGRTPLTTENVLLTNERTNERSNKRRRFSDI